MWTNNCVYWLPRKVWPVRIEVITSGCHVKLDLVELIKMVDYVSSEVRLEEGTPGIIPVTAQGECKQKHIKHNTDNKAKYKQRSKHEKIKPWKVKTKVWYTPEILGEEKKKNSHKNHNSSPLVLIHKCPNLLSYVERAEKEEFTRKNTMRHPHELSCSLLSKKSRVWKHFVFNKLIISFAWWQWSILWIFCPPPPRDRLTLVE